MEFSPNANVQLAIAEARMAGLFDAPIRSTQLLDDEGKRLIFHLANGRVVAWPRSKPPDDPEPDAIDPTQDARPAEGDANPAHTEPPSAGPPAGTSPTPTRRKK